MPRHGLKYCLICNPDGNGSKGRPGTEAVAKYYLPKGKEQVTYGNIPVCKDHAEMVSQFFEVTYFESGETTKIIHLTDNTDERIDAGPHPHHWDKMTLMGIEVDGVCVDHYKCLKCGAEGYWPLMDMTPDNGCSIPDNETEA